MALFGGGKIQWPSGQRPDNDPRWAEPIFPPVKWVNGHPQTEPAMVGGPRMVGGTFSKEGFLNAAAPPRMIGGIPQAAASTAPRVVGGIEQAAASTAPRMVGGIPQAAKRATPRMVGGIPQAMKKGGSVKAAASRIKSSASKRADGAATRGKTRGKIL